MLCKLLLILNFGSPLLVSNHGSESKVALTMLVIVQKYFGCANMVQRGSKESEVFTKCLRVVSDKCRDKIILK
jgi:hypothetical protein